MRLLLLLSCLLGAPAFGQDQLLDDLKLLDQRDADRCEMLAKASQAVVCIFAEPTAAGGGSGVIIDPRGYGLTNFHVVQEFIESREGFGGMSDGKLYPLRVLGIDAGGDIAVFKLQGREPFPYMPLADSDLLKSGQNVVALGNPFILAEDYKPTITYGVISGLHRYQEGQGNLLEYADCIQVSTSINPGNSGGPLIDMQGQLIGINGRASFEERGRVNVGLGYAVTINQIKRFLPGLRAGQFVEHGTLGMAVRAINGKLVVQAVQQLGPAEKAGIELGDVLLSLDGRTLQTANEFNNAIAILPARWPVTLALQRGDETLRVDARLERLVLRVSEKFVPNLEDNHNELRTFLGEARRTLQLTPGDNGWCADLTWDGPQRWCSEPAPSVPTGLDPEPVRVRWEFVRLLEPFMRDMELGVEWEWIGGDEVDGQVAGVIRYKPDDGATITWWLRYEDGRPLQIRFDYNDTQAATWRTKPGGAGGWPTNWERVSFVGEKQAVQVEKLEPLAEDGP